MMHIWLRFSIYVVTVSPLEKVLACALEHLVRKLSMNFDLLKFVSITNAPLQKYYSNITEILHFDYIPYLLQLQQKFLNLNI
jgi:hypothetical protein